MIRRPSLCNLRARLLLLVLLALVPTSALTLYTAAEARRTAAVEAQEDALRLARLTAANQARVIEGGRQLLVALAQLPAVREGDAAACNALFAGLQEHYPEYSSFTAVDLEGTIFCSAVPLPQPVNVADRPWFQRIRQAPAFTINEYLVGRITGKPIVVLAYPVTDDAGQVQAYVTAGLELGWLNQVAAKVPLPAGATLTVVDRNGTVLARYPDPEQWTGRPLPEAAVVEALLTQREGTIEIPAADGSVHWYSFTPLGDPPGCAYVTVSIPKSVALAKTNAALLSNLIRLGFITLLAFTAAWFGGYTFILRPVGVLLSATRRLATGDLKTRTGAPRGAGELSQLAHAFDTMAAALEQRVTQLKQTEEELRKTNERLQTLIDTSPLALYTLDPAGNVTSWNPAAEQLFGWRAEDVLGRPLPIVPPDNQDEFRALLLRQLQGETFLGLEYRWQRRDGALIDISLFTAPLHDSTGAISGVISFLSDISDQKRAEAALQDSEARYRAVIEQSADCICLIDLETKRLIEANPATGRLLGYAAEELLQLTIDDVITQERDHIDQTIQRLLTGQGLFAGEGRLCRKDGTFVDVEVRMNLISYQSKRVLCAVIRDVSERKQAEEALRQREERFRSLLQNLSDIIIVMDSEGVIRYVSPSVERTLGYPPDVFLEQPLATFGPQLIHPEDRPQLTAFLTQILQQPGDHQAGEFRIRHCDGSWRYLRPIATNLLHEPSVGGVVISARDITERKLFQEQLARQAFYDSLTGLPNRALFMDRLQHALNRANRYGDTVAVLFLDLDRFKFINDSLGHSAGDQLLVSVARRLAPLVRPSDTLARFGGDEFTLLLEGIPSTRDALQVAERIAGALRAPFTLDGREVFITASIGIALSTPAHHPEDLLRQADIALYRAKAAGRARSMLFEEGWTTPGVAQLDLEADLRRALDRGELCLHYQPTVALKTGRLSSVETLLRWQHPQRGLLPPANFLPLAEETGLIVPISRWVLEEACRQVRQWQQRFPHTLPLQVSVNLSPRDLQQPDFLKHVAAVLIKTDLDPACLTLEITERLLLEDSATTLKTLQDLKGLGVHLTIDDFGMGYSPLSHLLRFTFDTLKIDRSLVSKLSEDERYRAIAQTVTMLAHALNMEVTAEGIETPAQLAWVCDAGCDYGQGYYFAAPVDAETMERLLADQVLLPVHGAGTGHNNLARFPLW